MARFNKVSAELLDELKQVLGEKGVTVDPEKLQTYQTDEEGNETLLFVEDEAELDMAFEEFKSRMNDEFDFEE